MKIDGTNDRRNGLLGNIPTVELEVEVMSNRERRLAPPILQLFADMKRFRSPNGHWAAQCDLYQLEKITGVPPHLWGLRRPDTANAVIFSTGQINLKEEMRSPIFNIARKSPSVTSRVVQFFVEWDANC